LGARGQASLLARTFVTGEYFEVLDTFLRRLRRLMISAASHSLTAFFRLLYFGLELIWSLFVYVRFKNLNECNFVQAHRREGRKE
jgi:hypothetical protein